MTITKTEINVLKVMSEKDMDWSWIILDRALSTKGIPGFGNVARIVTNLAEHGLVDVIYNEETKRSRYRVSENGFKALKEEHLTEHDLP